MNKGRPKGEHKTMISARLTDEALETLEHIEWFYNIKKSAFINKAIIEYYKIWKEFNYQTKLELQ